MADTGAGGRGAQAGGSDNREAGDAARTPGRVAAAGAADAARHILHQPWTLFFFRRQHTSTGKRDYTASIKKVATVSTVEDFWHYYNYMVRPNDLPNTSDYHLFKAGVHPTWEDEGNKAGGKWLVRVRKGLANRCWEDLLLALIGEQFGDLNDHVCGAVLSVRYAEDIVALWNKDAADRKACLALRDAMRDVMPMLPSGTTFEYKAHNDSLRDKSSFRNTLRDA